MSERDFSYTDYSQAKVDEDATTEESTGPNWLKMAGDAYTSSTSYFDINIRPGVEDSLRMFANKHSLGSKYLSDAWRGKSRLFRPKTRTTIRKNEAIAASAFFSTEDVIATRPVDPENPSHLSASRLYKELLQFRLTKSIPWFVICMGGIQDAQTTGVVISHQFWKYDEKKKIDRPAVELRPVENVRLDPACDWTDPINTSPYLIDLMPMYIKDIKAKQASGEWKQVSERSLQAALSQDYDSTRMLREDRVDSKSNPTAINDFSIVWVNRNIIEHESEDYIFYTLGTETLLSDPVPLVEKYKHGLRPYVMGISIIETHKTYPSSLPKLVKPVQQEINEIANQRLENIKLVLNKRYMVKRNKNVDLNSLTRNIAGSVTLLTEQEDVRVEQTGDVTGSSFQEQDRLNLDFDDVVGAFSGSSVQSNRSLNETVGGMNILATQSTMISEYQLRTITETWVVPVLNQIVLLEKYYETDETIIQIAGKKAQIWKQGMQAVHPEIWNQEILIWVNVGIGSVNPQTKLERFGFGLEMIGKFLPQLMMQLNDEEVCAEVFGCLGYRDGARFFDPNKDLTNPKEEAMFKLEMAMKKAQIDKFASEAIFKNIEALYSAMQTAQVAVTIPGTTSVADAIAKSAGYVDKDPPPIFPTNVPQMAPAAPSMLPGGNPHPNLPANPQGPTEGMMQGIETPAADGATL